MKHIFLVTILFSVSVFAAPFNQTNVEIDRLGGQVGQVFYANLKEGFKTDCAYGNLYCPVSNDSCKYFFTIALAAKMANKKLLSIDYTQDPTSKYCSIDMIQIN